MANRAVKIGYVVERFPKLSETFILNEVLELERRGTPLEIFSLNEPLEEPRHGALKEVRAPVTYLPEGNLSECQIREDRHAEGLFHQRPFQALFRGGKLPKTLALPNILGRLVKQVRNSEELSLFAAQVHFIPQAAALTALAKAKGVGHLHAHFAERATTVAMLAGRLSSLSFSFTAHAWDIYDQKRVDRAFLKEKIRRARFVVTVSDYNRRGLRMLCGEEAARKIIRVYNGVDLSRFRPDPSVVRQPDFILAVGRLVEKKGFRDLIYACRLLRDRGRSFRCLIVGEGEERERLTRQIGALRVDDHVKLIGARPQEQVVRMMSEATLLVLPCVVNASGDRDGLPTVLLEALAVGLPAISTTVSGISEIIEHGKTGFLVTPGDSISLAATIEEVLKDPHLRERSARGGIRKARQSFDIRKNVKILRDHLTRSRLISTRSRV